MIRNRRLTIHRNVKTWLLYLTWCLIRKEIHAKSKLVIFSIALLVSDVKTCITVLMVLQGLMCVNYSFYNSIRPWWFISLYLHDKRFVISHQVIFHKCCWKLFHQSVFMCAEKKWGGVGGSFKIQFSIVNLRKMFIARKSWGGGRPPALPPDATCLKNTTEL